MPRSDTHQELITITCDDYTRLCTINKAILEATSFEGVLVYVSDTEIQLIVDSAEREISWLISAEIIDPTVDTYQLHFANDNCTGTTLSMVDFVGRWVTALPTDQLDKQAEAMLQRAGTIPVSTTNVVAAHNRNLALKIVRRCRAEKFSRSKQGDLV